MSSPAPDQTIYSLWHIPRGILYRRLTQTIQHFSQACRTPQFEPHLTLLGGITGKEDQVISHTARLAGLLHRYPIQLTDLSGLQEYFRCLFVSVEPAEPVMAAGAQARDLFQHQHDPAYLPHVSLMYGDCSGQIKQAIIARLGNTFSGTFTADSIYLYDTSGQPEAWRRVRAFSLT
jgi:2'-5' RNA ligase